MSDAPKRIWAQDAEPSECNFIGGGWWDDSIGNTQYPDVAEYHRADLSADLVRAAYLAGVMDVQKIASDAEVFDVSDEAEYLAADHEAVAAIVAQVMEKEHD